jgi:hypothetical protein
MLIRLLFGVFSDVVFEYSASERRDYATQLDRYLERRGFEPTMPRAASR